MEIGYTKDLLILPFDHRGTFGEKMFNAKGRPLLADETAKISEFKMIIYEAYKKALEMGVKKESAGILIDEQYGGEVIADASKNGITFALTMEKSGQEEFDFEYGEQFGEHLEKFNAPIGKVLVRFNVEGDGEVNRRQLVRLRKASNYIHSKGRKFLFELLVPATKVQLEKFYGEKAKYDLNLRPKLMVRAIHEIQLAGIEPDIWKLEGMEDPEDVKMVVSACKANGTQAGVIVLGRGENADKVKQWLIAGANIPGVIGFAIGRTVFWDSLVKYYGRKITREQAVDEIAGIYKMFVDLWFDARKK